ncbi:MAG: hypothetical protein MN733_38415, partial [Nitrososphaera sp.]|nr:hypothetical protein [Nitrososphaera sp.]
MTPSHYPWNARVVKRLGRYPPDVLACSCIAIHSGKSSTTDETWRAEGEVEEPAIGARRRTKQETHRAVKSVWELCRTAQWCDAADAGRIAAPIACRVMRVHFGDRTAEMHHEHSDTPDAARLGIRPAELEKGIATIDP